MRCGDAQQSRLGSQAYATRSDARYCSPACRQRAHRERAGIRDEGPVTAKPVKPDLDRPVPVAHHDWQEARFWIFSDPWGDHPTASMPTRLADDTAVTLREYVFGVACIGRVTERDDDAYPYDMFTRLPDELPNDITPRLAEILASWLAPALDRARELLNLLARRGHKDPAVTRVM